MYNIIWILISAWNEKRILLFLSLSLFRGNLYPEVWDWKDHIERPAELSRMWRPSPRSVRQGRNRSSAAAGAAGAASRQRGSG